MVILRRIMVYPPKNPSVLGCPLPETGPRVDLNIGSRLMAWLSSKNIGLPSVLGCPLVRDTAEGGLGVLMAWLSSAVPCQRILGLMAIGRTRLSPARDRAEGGLGILMAWLSSEEYWFTIGSRLSPARDRAEGGLGILMALLSSEE